MLTRHVRDSITWVDLESPTRDELRDVMREFSIDPRIEEEIVSPTPYPLVVSSDAYVFLILHFPTTDPHGGARNQEIDLIVGKDFIITSRYEVLTAVHNLHKVFEAEDLLRLPSTHLKGDALVERIMRQLYGAIREEVEETSRLLDRIEEDIFSGKERETVLNISLIGRILLRFDTTLARHRQPLQTFLNELCATKYFGPKFVTTQARIMAEHDHSVSLVASYRAAATELRDTNDSLLTSSQNEIIKRLTIITAAAFPLTFITGVFGMNTTHLPFMEGKNATLIIFIIMVATLAAFLGYFRHKKWI